MLVLAIETSGDIASVTLAREDALVSQITFRHKMDLLRRLMPNVDGLLTDSRIDKPSIDGVVVSIGPGSFTGLRIGVATAKAIAYGLKKPLIGIATLDVLAQQATPAEGLVVPVIHARPGEVYAAVFRSRGLRVERVGEDRAVAINDLAQELCEGGEHVVFCGDGAERNSEVLLSAVPEAMVLPSWLSYPHGEVLASLGIERLANGQCDDPLTLVPHYVKRSTPEIRAEQAGQA